MRRRHAFLVGHLAALSLGLVGLLIALPNPQLWLHMPFGPTLFGWGMQYGGALHILFGMLAMLVAGQAVLGWRRTLLFAVAAVGLSLLSELIGTGTGWPFGNYHYTAGLGAKIAGRVPFTIPLSWCYMGLCSYMLALAISRGRWRWWQTVLLGAWLLTIWDLVLDPAMAHPELPVRYWIWHETGAYYGMPIKNLIGWSVTAAIFMAVSRLLWRDEPVVDPASLRTPALVYGANLLFGAALSLSVGIWLPVIATTIAAAITLAPLWWPRRWTTMAPATQTLGPDRA